MKTKITTEQVLTITLNKEEWIKLKLALYECRWGEPTKGRRFLNKLDYETHEVPPEWNDDFASERLNNNYETNQL